MEAMIKIGEAAAAAGVSVQTLRFYEECGFLGTPRRTKGGFRLYRRTVIRHVRFIKKAQSLGFTLEESAVLLAVYRSRSPACRDVKPLVARKLFEVETKIDELRRQRKSLRRMLGVVPVTVSASTRCPILSTLAEEHSEKSVHSATASR